MSNNANTMTCIQVAEPGGPEVLRPIRCPVPEPGSGEVLVRVRAAGVNRPDVMQRQGMYPPPPGAPDTPGLEIAGTVIAHGPEVQMPAIGAQVCALVPGGGYAEYCVAAAPLCLPVPSSLDTVQAAGIPETFFTVWTNVFDRGRLRSGERILIHGGASGIGTTAIQMAVEAGARVYITAGSAEKCAVCRALGADAAINYREQDFVAEIAALTDGGGVDLILDMIGGDYLPRNLACLAVEGRLVQIALQHGPKCELNLLKIMLGRFTITGSTLRARPVAEKSAIAAALKREIWPALESGRLKPVIHATFPLERVGDAHRLMDSGAHIGKLILTNDW